MPVALPCIVLAAGKVSQPLLDATGFNDKVLIPVAGKATIKRVLTALDESPYIGDVRVVCRSGADISAVTDAQCVMAKGPDFMDSVMTGLEALGNPSQVLLVTGDLPLLTAEAVTHFCKEGLSSGAEIVYCVCSRETCETAMPNAKRTYVRLAGGAVTGGNLALLSRRFIVEETKRLAEVFKGRKNPLQLIAMVGWGMLWKMLIGRATIAQIVQCASRILNTSMYVVVSPYPEIGFDVDKPQQIAIAEKYLQSKSRD